MHSPTSDKGIVTLLHLDSYKRKNIKRLVEAFGELKEEGHEAKLSIYGGGSKKSQNAINSFIKLYDVADCVKLCGVLQHENVQNTLNQYEGFVLASKEKHSAWYSLKHFRRYSYSLPKNRAIDGFFDGLDIGFKCNPNDLSEIKSGILQLIERQKQLKQNIAEAHQTNFFKYLMKMKLPANMMKSSQIFKTANTQ